MIFENEYGSIYFAYKRAYKNGTWCPTDPGSYLGWIIIWKLDSTEHMDNKDNAPTATFTVDKDHVGGEIQILQLQSQFWYGAGVVVIRQTGFLWHKVKDWEARPCTEPEMEKKGLTPGCVGISNYVPEDSFAQLQGQDKNWGCQTLWGIIILRKLRVVQLRLRGRKRLTDTSKITIQYCFVCKKVLSKQLPDFSYIMDHSDTLQICLL